MIVVKIKKKLSIKDRSIVEYILVLAVLAMIYAKYTDAPKGLRFVDPARPDYRFIGDFPPYYGGTP